MENVKITFQIIPNGKELPNWFQYINGHMVFDFKMEDSQRQAFLVAGDYMIYTPDIITYSSELYIAPTMATLHDLGRHQRSRCMKCLCDCT